VNRLHDLVSNKALTLVAGVLLLGAIYFVVVSPLSSYYEKTAQRVVEREELVHRYQDAVRDLPRLRAAEALAKDQPPGRDLLLIGSTDSVAAAALQSALKVLVELEGAKLNSAEMLPPEAGENVVRRVGVRVAFTGNLRLLATVLEGVEATRPFLSVGNLNVRTAGDLDDKDEDRALGVVMDVFGFHSQ
jgi:hypothetical protein